MSEHCVLRENEIGDLSMIAKKRKISIDSKNRFNKYDTAIRQQRRRRKKDMSHTFIQFSKVI